MGPKRTLCGRLECSLDLTVHGRAVPGGYSKPPPLLIHLHCALHMPSKHDQLQTVEDPACAYGRQIVTAAAALDRIVC